MKHQITILCIYIIFSTSSFSQTAFQLSIGVKQMKIEKKSIDFWYVDESPSRDNISKHIELKGSYSIDLGFRFTGRKARILNWAFEGHGYFGSLGGLDLGLGTIFTSKNKDKSFRFEPELMLIGGYCQKGIGEIQNNDIYIQVNDIKFKDHTNVSVKLQNYYFGFKPGLSMSFKLKNGRHLGIRGSYQYSLKAPALALMEKMI